jgi:DnaK suppressor protein
MNRSAALNRLYQRLLAHREELEQMLVNDSEATGDLGFGSSDLGDLAVDDTEREMRSQLASLESDELGRIERALQALRDGRYGKCERCEKSIPIERLEALPHTVRCVRCQHSAERPFRRRMMKADWESVSVIENNQSEREINLDELDVGIDR